MYQNFELPNACWPSGISLQICWPSAAAIELRGAVERGQSLLRHPSHHSSWMKTAGQVQHRLTRPGLRPEAWPDLNCWSCRVLRAISRYETEAPDPDASTATCRYGFTAPLLRLLYRSAVAGDFGMINDEIVVVDFASLGIYFLFPPYFFLTCTLLLRLLPWFFPLYSFLLLSFLLLSFSSLSSLDHSKSQAWLFAG